MDSERFDGLVRSFGQTRSRRQTMRGLTGAAAAGAFALSGRGASAEHSASVPGKACKNDGQCCSDLKCLSSGSGAKIAHASTGCTAGSGKVCTDTAASDVRRG